MADGVNWVARCQTWKSTIRNFAATRGTIPKKISSRSAHENYRPSALDAHFFVERTVCRTVWNFGTNRRLAVPKGGSPCTVTESANHRELGFGTKVRQRLANETKVNRAKQAAAMLTERLFYRTDFPREIKLLQQVKVPNVAGQHRTSVFSSGGE